MKTELGQYIHTAISRNEGCPSSFSTSTETVLFLASKDKRLDYPDYEKALRLLPERVPLMIPRRYLFGRQSIEEYDETKRKEVEQAFKKYGNQSLKENPVYACALHGKDALQLAVIDGHHRIRYAGKFGIHNIPTKIYSPEEMAEAINLAQPYLNYSDVKFIDTLNFELNRAAASFSRVLPPEKMSLPVGNVRDIDQLPFNRAA